jgi:hypothetical protein
LPKIFTPNEAAALIEISPKRIYKEIEHRIIHTDAPNHHQLSFGTLVYLRALKEIDLRIMAIDGQQFQIQKSYG